MKKLNLGVILMFVFGIAMFTSCEKDNINTEETISNLSLEQMKNRDNLKRVALTVLDITDTIELCIDVYNAVNQSLNLGLDEQYRFSDILHPEKSSVLGLKSSKVGKFGKCFFNAINNRTLKSNTTTDLVSFVLNNNVQIYWPYSDNWDGEILPTISFDPIENINHNIGYKRIIGEDGTFCIDTVIVDDDYAYNNPVWIINYCDYSDSMILKASLKNEKLKSSSTVHQLSIGWIKNNKHHYDNIFHGGDEYNFCLIGGDITNMHTANVYHNIQTVTLTRKQIRKKKWKRVYYELDDDWYASGDDIEMSRKFGLIEYDKKATERKLTFEPKVTIDGVSISAGSYTITQKSDEGWIKVDTYRDRDKMIDHQKINMGNGLKDGYRIYGAGDIYWTLPIREF